MKSLPLLTAKSSKILITILVSIIVLTGVTTLILANYNPRSNNKPEIKQEQVQKKIDGSKEWVYDADYGFENKVLKDPWGTATFNSKDMLIVPYININSEYANSINKEIKELYEREYADFAKTAERNLVWINIKYEYFYNEDILSVMIWKKKGLMNAGVSNTFTTYNINLNTLNKATLEDCFKAIGYNSKEQLDLSIKSTISDEIEKEHLLSDVTWNYDELFIDKNGKINLIV
nr:hypothetical protein [Clostridia bacterium]